MLHIGQTQVAWEERADAVAKPLTLICDTSPLTTEWYSSKMFGSCDWKLDKLAKRTYDRVFICANDFPFVQDGTRNSPEFSQEQFDYYKRYYPKAPILSGSLQERCAQVISTLKG